LAVEKAAKLAFRMVGSSAAWTAYHSVAKWVLTLVDGKAASWVDWKAALKVASTVE